MRCRDTIELRLFMRGQTPPFGDYSVGPACYSPEGSRTIPCVGRGWRIGALPLGIAERRVTDQMLIRASSALLVDELRIMKRGSKSRIAFASVGLGNGECRKAHARCNGKNTQDIAD